MYKFFIIKTFYLNSKPELLEKFSSKNILKGMKKSLNQAQFYINNGTVNDYTSFATVIMEHNGKFYNVFRDLKLEHDKSITLDLIPA